MAEWLTFNKLFGLALLAFMAWCIYQGLFKGEPKDTDDTPEHLPDPGDDIPG